MKFLNVEIPVKARPKLDDGFVPFSLFWAQHQKLASQPFAIALQREDGYISVYDMKVTGQPQTREADLYVLRRVLKFMLWSRGGYRVWLCGDESLGAEVGADYRLGGARAFDVEFMEQVYRQPFEVQLCAYQNKPQPKESSMLVGRHLQGCRIGFDAGGSDRKVSAVIDGVPVFSQEVVWLPKENSDPAYHYNGIVSAFKAAAGHMPRVDAIGVSSAGVYVDNSCRVASLFLKVSKRDFEEKVQDIYVRAAKEIGDVPLAVANDGDVTALAGAIGLEDVGVLGIAMGTSEAVGYVDMQGNITGWLNELAFAPLDCQPGALRDEWSGDIGCGVKYLSQDGVIKLAGMAGVDLQGKTPAQKLKEVQQLMAQKDPRAKAIYQDMGCYLGHALGLYALFYPIKHVLMLGRVMSGEGGDIILKEAAAVLAQDYPHLAFAPQAPDEKARRVGQSVAAASLPR